MHLVQRITATHGRKIVAVLEDLLDRARGGQLTSLAYVAEELDQGDSLLGVVGRFRDEPTKLIGELAVMNVKLAKYATTKRRPDFQHSTM